MGGNGVGIGSEAGWRSSGWGYCFRVGVGREGFWGLVGRMSDWLLFGLSLWFGLGRQTGADPTGGGGDVLMVVDVVKSFFGHWLR